jgi:hypothetical protein
MEKGAAMEEGQPLDLPQPRHTTAAQLIAGAQGLTVHGVRSEGGTSQGAEPGRHEQGLATGRSGAASEGVEARRREQGLAAGRSGLWAPHQV